MYSRVSSFKGDASKLGDLEARVDGVKSQMAAIKGIVASYASWNEDAVGVTVTVYESEAAANAAAPQVQQIWGGLADLLIAPPSIASYSRVESMV